MISNYIIKYKLKKKFFYIIRDEDFLASFLKKTKIKKNVLLRFIFFRKFYRKFIYTWKTKYLTFLNKKFRILSLFLFSKIQDKKLKLKRFKIISKKLILNFNIKEKIKNVFDFKTLYFLEKIYKKRNFLRWKSFFKLKIRNKVLYPEYSKLLSFAPKQKIKRLKKKKYINKSITTYKGQFNKFIQFQLYYGIIKIKKLKKLIKYLKYKKNKYNIFVLTFDWKCFFLIYKLHIINKLKTSFFYIKKFGLEINFLKTKNPFLIIKPYSIINITDKLKINFLKKLKKNFIKFLYWFNLMPFYILFNYRTLSFIIINKTIDNIFLNDSKTLLEKKSNFIKSHTLMNFIKFNKRR